MGVDFPILHSTATIVDNNSDEFIEATAIVGVDLNAKGQQMPQRFGSASSYGKKYALGNLLLIDDTADSDATNDHGFSNKVQSLEKKIMANKKPLIDSNNLDQAKKNQSITLTLKDEIDCSRGQIITNKNSDIELSDQFESTIIWMNEKSMIFGRSYYLKIGTQTVSVCVSRPKYKIN